MPGEPLPVESPPAARPAVDWDDDPTVKIAGGIVIGLVAVVLALLECFFVPLRFNGWLIPVAFVAAFAGNIVLPAMMVAVTGARMTAIVPTIAWFLVVVLAASRTTEGDLILGSGGDNIAFLFVGALGAAYGSGRVISARQRK